MIDALISCVRGVVVDCPSNLIPDQVPSKKTLHINVSDTFMSTLDPCHITSTQQHLFDQCGSAVAIQSKRKASHNLENHAILSTPQQPAYLLDFKITSWSIAF